MKRVIFVFSILVVMICMTINAFGQTSLEEYNYVTKGYRVQIESGLDMKKGYKFEDIDKSSTSERSAELKVLYRVNDGKKTIAAYLIIYNRNGLDPEYICIPMPNSAQEIMDKYWTQLYDGSTFASERLQLISFLISKRMIW